MRLPSGYGSVYKQAGNRRKPWVVRVTTGWCEETGTQIRYVVGYYKQRSEALDALAEYNKNPIGTDRGLTLGELYKTWSDRYYKEATKSVVNGYKAAWKRLEHLTDLEVRSIYKIPLQDVVEKMKREKLSRSTMEKYKTLVGLLWQDAMSNRIVDRNYGTLIDLPEARKAKKPIFTDLEIKAISDAAAKGNIWAGTVMILLYTGMRVGELLTLTQFNVDLKNWAITGGIKTDAGKDRYMPVHPKIKQYLLYWSNKPGDRLIHRNKRAISVDYYRKHLFYPLLEELEIKRTETRNLTPHSTRHTFGTLLNRAGAKTTAIQKLMGHSDYSTTANIYTHPDYQELIQAISLI